jgi:hypothetical protein
MILLVSDTYEDVAYSVATTKGAQCANQGVCFTTVSPGKLAEAVFSGGAAANFVQDTDFFEFFVFLSSSR